MKEDGLILNVVVQHTFYQTSLSFDFLIQVFTIINLAKSLF